MRAPPPRPRPARIADRPVPACSALAKTIRIYMERDPIVLFSCTIGLFGECRYARAPLLAGGRKMREGDGEAHDKLA